MHSVLNLFHGRKPFTCVIEGEALGADQLARNWALLNKIPVEPYFADWRLFSHRAGSIRNSRMLREGKPEMAIGFPGGAGTKDMTRKLIEARVPLVFGRYDNKVIRWKHVLLK